MTQLQRPGEKSESDHVSDDECDDYPVSKQDVLKWSSKKKIVLLNGMIKLKPAGMHKHLNMLLIREDVSKNLKKTVPTVAIWKYFHSVWDTDMADNIEKHTITFNKEDFDLPKDEEWTQLIQEQKKILNLNKNKDAIDKAAINNMDLKLLKSVKVMVEKLDTRNLLINCLKLNNVLNWEKTLNNSPSGFQQESTSSNLNINVKKNVSDGVDLNAENGLEEYIVKDQSTDVPKRSISSEKHLRTEKKKCISVSGTCNLKNPIFARSTRASHTLNYNYDTEHLNKHQDLKEFEENILDVIMSKPALRVFFLTTLDNTSRSYGSQINNSTYASNLKSILKITPNII